MNNLELEMYIVATPIGNLNDISERAIKTFKDCDFIICENPKHSLKLLNKLGIKKKLISLHDYNEKIVIQRLSREKGHKKAVLISDAGSPLISDPGFKLIEYCIKNNIKTTSIPGATSVIPALQLSGMPINQFYFAGFFPKTRNQMVTFIQNIGKLDKTSVFFVSSHKIRNCVDIIELEMFDRMISISKELTKINEKTFRGLGGNIKNLLMVDQNNLKGEFVVVVEGKLNEKNDLDIFDVEINKLLSKFSLTDVVEIVHKLTSINKNKVYKWVLNIKKN